MLSDCTQVAILNLKWLFMHFSAGESALHIAGKLGNANLVTMLIHQGADLSLQDNNSNTMLHIVAMEYAENPNNAKKYIQVPVTL